MQPSVRRSIEAGAVAEDVVPDPSALKVGELVMGDIRLEDGFVGAAILAV